jgi:hypothetical protein
LLRICAVLLRFVRAVDSFDAPAIGSMVCIETHRKKHITQQQATSPLPNGL